jgi:hypothetical protein
MYCDRCGTSVGTGGQFCSVCGKQLVAVGGAVLPPPAASVPAEARVQRHIQLLAWLWFANGVLRLLGVGWLLVAGRLFFPFFREGIGPLAWPFGRGLGLESLLWGGLYSVGILLGLFGVVHLVLAWGLFERQPWARMLGVIVGFLALLRFPLGTALGIYTLWVLLPESSAREYDELARSGAALSSARYTS